MSTRRANGPDFAAAQALETRVWEQVGQNNVKQAMALCFDLTRQFPDFAPGWHTASQLALKVNQPLAALDAIEKSLVLEPDRTPWVLQQAMCVAKLGRMKELEPLVEGLVSRKMDTAYQCATIGLLLTQLGRRAQAVGLYEKAVAIEPDEAKHYYNIACLQRTLGNIDAAEQYFDKTISLNPADYESYKIRSELRHQTATNNHIDVLEQLLARDFDDQRGKVHIYFALAKELEDLGEYERSFHYLKMGADLRRRRMQYHVQRDLDTMSALQRTFGADMFNGSKVGDSNAEAIFVLGLPRTGTTLVERILASHSDVFAAGELNNFSVQMMNAMRNLSVGKEVARDDLVQLSATLNFQELGAAYIDSTRPFTGHTARFIDKLPLNYLYAGLIHLALPNAKIVVLERSPLDTCYAIYKQLFTDAYPFSYDLVELARYYVAYHTLMQHWKLVMPGVVHVVNYETLVVDIEGESRRLLEYCDLKWQSQCLKFYENKAASTTASTVQIRQPVYQTSVGKWRNVAQQMQPVIDTLREAGIDPGI